MKLFSFKKKKPSTLAAETTKSKGFFHGDTHKEQYKEKHSRKTSPQPEETDKKAQEKKSKAASVSTPASADAQVLLRPRITEKATLLDEQHNVYVFEVTPQGNKNQVKKAVQALYNVTPVKVAMVKVPAKNIISRGKRGVKKGGKKAYVFLKKGDTIETV